MQLIYLVKRWEGHVARMGDMRNAYSILVGKQRKRPLGRPRRNGKMILEWFLEK
jgi:hypothetical protein